MPTDVHGLVPDKPKVEPLTVVYQIVRAAHDDDLGCVVERPTDAPLRLTRESAEAEIQRIYRAERARARQSRDAAHADRKALWAQRKAEHEALVAAGLRLVQFTEPQPIPDPVRRGEHRYGVRELQVLP